VPQAPCQQIEGLARGLRDALVHLDARELSPQECISLGKALALTEKACGAARGFVVRAAASRGDLRADGRGDPSDWEASLAGTTRAVARRALGTLGALDRTYAPGPHRWRLPAGTMECSGLIM